MVQERCWDAQKDRPADFFSILLEIPLTVGLDKEYTDPMRLHSHRTLSMLSGTLIVLFFALSFNAYACLLPVNGATPTSMGNGCSTPDEQPVYQFCDSFKTLGVQSADKLHLDSDCQTICSEDTASLGLLAVLTSDSSRLSNHPTVGPPQDLLLKISVLRI